MTELSNSDILKQSLQVRVDLRRNGSSNSQMKYLCFEELVLAYGKAMTPKPLPKTVKRGLPRNCYFNCQELVFQNPQLTYCEGFAMNDVGIPLSHAWLLSSKGFVVDPTWEQAGEAYWGIAFSTEWIKSFLNSRLDRGKLTVLSIFEGNYLEGFSLLKQEFPLEALAHYNVN